MNRHNESKGSFPLTSSDEKEYDFDLNNNESSVELEVDETEQISLIDKLMIGCGILTLIIPVFLLVLGSVLLMLAQIP